MNDVLAQLAAEQQALSRRAFLRSSSLGLLALGGLLGGGAALAGETVPLGLPHIPAKAKRIIYLFMAGAPSQFETFDYKPKLAALAGTELPPSVRKGQRLTGMTSGQKTLPIVPSKYGFSRHGESGQWIGDLLPHLAKHADDLCIIRSVFTEAINHDPAVTLLQSGSQIAGRPSIGSWLAYGLGSENRNLPDYTVLMSSGPGHSQPLAERNWGAGFLPAKYQGVKLQGNGDPVPYLRDPEGLAKTTRREMLDDLAKLNQQAFKRVLDPDIESRIAQYELAYRMQTSVPDLVDFSKEDAAVIDSYGPDARKPGTYAANCLLARRLAEKGVRCIQLFHRGWDQHFNLNRDIAGQCESIDQPTAALLQDLKQRGLLEDTLVVWGGEFGRTVYGQGSGKVDAVGRDHHPRCFPMWLAGAGVTKGTTIGETDDFSYNIVADPVHIHDLHATIMHLMGIDHQQLTYTFQGRRFRLTDVAGELITRALA